MNERAETHACDLIERQVARLAKCPFDGLNDYQKGWNDACDAIAENAPPAQPGPIRINLNDSIKVKLTDWGKEIYYHRFDRVNKTVGRELCRPSYPEEDESGYTEFQLWRFIELYGMHIGMTLPNVIEPLEMVYERMKE